MSVQVFIGIGSNQGDRLGNCRAAVEQLRLLPETGVVHVSPFFGSEPQEGVEGGMFLNGVVEICTDLSPRCLLSRLQEIEVALGRPRDHQPATGRSMDLDILLYGESVVEEPGLSIPHPRMVRRGFVLAPLAAVAPAARHPILQLTAAELLRRLGPEPPTSAREVGQ